MNKDDDGLLKVFSNKVFLLGLVIVAILVLGSYKKTDEQVRENDGVVTTNTIESIRY